MYRKMTLTFVLLVVIGLLLVACGGAEPTSAPETIAEGKKQYLATCSACHGADARGVENLGRTLIGSEFVQDSTDAELLEYVKVGRAVDDPLNTTGIAMPPKGGNPALTDGQIDSIIAYIRSIN
jgi:disulfide bond formation protein DsbB